MRRLILVAVVVVISSAVLLVSVSSGHDLRSHGTTPDRPTGDGASPGRDLRPSLEAPGDPGGHAKTVCGRIVDVSSENITVDGWIIPLRGAVSVKDLDGNPMPCSRLQVGDYVEVRLLGGTEAVISRVTAERGRRNKAMNRTLEVR